MKMSEHQLNDLKILTKTIPCSLETFREHRHLTRYPPTVSQKTSLQTSIQRYREAPFPRDWRTIFSVRFWR